jgi:chromosome segregation ATPase
MEVLRLNIEALSDGSVVLPTLSNVGRQASDVRLNLSDSLLDARITEMLTQKTEPLLAELAAIKVSQTEAIERAKAELRTELLGELAVQSDHNEEESLRQQLQETQEELKQTQEQPAIASQELDATNQKLTAAEQQLAEVRSQLDTERASRTQVEAQLSELQQNPATVIDLSGKAGEVVNLFRTLLPKDTKLPKNTMSKLREILEATED